MVMRWRYGTTMIAIHEKTVSRWIMLFEIILSWKWKVDHRYALYLVRRGGRNMICLFWFALFPRFILMHSWPIISWHPYGESINEHISSYFSRQSCVIWISMHHWNFIVKINTSQPKTCTCSVRCRGLIGFVSDNSYPCPSGVPYTDSDIPVMIAGITGFQ